MKEIDLKMRHSYLMHDSTSDKAFELLNLKINNGFSGMCITRSDPQEIGARYGLDIPVILLSSSKDSDVPCVSDMTSLKSKIKTHIKKNPKSIVLLDRLDYLVNMHGFGKVLRFVYSMNDEILSNDSILLLNINPLTLSQQQLTLLKQELLEIPLKSGDSQGDIEDDLHEILSYVNNTEKASFKRVSKEFSITKTTTRKRINRLLELGYISVKKNGRNKIVRITEMGKNYL